MPYLAISIDQVSEDIHLFWNYFCCIDSRNKVLMNPLSMLTSGIILKSFLLGWDCSTWIIMLGMNFASRLSRLNSLNQTRKTLKWLTGMLIVSMFFPNLVSYYGEQYWKSYGGLAIPELAMLVQNIHMKYTYVFVLRYCLSVEILKSFRAWAQLYSCQAEFPSWSMLAGSLSLLCSGECDLSHFKKKDRKEEKLSRWAAQAIKLNYYLASPSHLPS